MILDFHISARCADQCVFCSVSDRMRAYRAHEIRWDEIRDSLIEMRKAGIVYVNFTGGEPTTHRDFAKSVRLAKSLGFRTCVTTNGTGLVRADRAGRILPGLDEITVSLHGATAAVHDANSRSPGSFDRLTRVLDLLDSNPSPPVVRINTVMTTLNFSELPDIVALVSRRPSVRFHLLSAISPSDDGLHNYDRMAVRLSDIARIAPALVEAGRAAGISVHFFGVPPCVLGPLAALSDDFYFTRRVTLEREMEGGIPYLQKVESDNPTRLREYPAACDGCHLRKPELCGGVYAAYIEKFGESEIGWNKRTHGTRKETLDQAYAGL